MNLRHMSMQDFLREQFTGIIREQSSSRILMAGIKPSPARPRPESGKPVDIRRVLGAGESKKKMIRVDEKLRRVREAEKAEKVLHLICWGPFN